MNTKLTSALIFVGGAAIGSIVTWQLVKESYRKLAEQEIASVREYYKGRYEGPQQSEPTQGETNKSAYLSKREITKEETEMVTKYSTLTDAYISPENKQDVEYDTEPYVISPDLFGELDGYETMSLTYYADGVLVDDQGDVMHDADDVVGKDFAEHIGDYEPDAVHIRNDWNQCDYEILAVTDRYADIPHADPHQMEVEWDKMK